MSTPLVKLDMEMIADCASKAMTQEQIAVIFDCSVDTIQRRAGAALKKGYALRNGSLQQKQYEVAMSGNPTMLIWLGKQFLKQRDKTDQSTEGQEFGLDGIPTPEASATRPN